MISTWLIVGAFAFAAIGFWVLWNADSRRGSLARLQPRMDNFAQQAVELAGREFKIELDYQLETLERLEEILDQFHRRHLANPIGEKDLSQIVLTWGAYLGSTLQRLHGGTWQSDSIVAGANTYPLQWKDNEATPVMWCLRRIRRGAAFPLAETVRELDRSLSGSRDESDI